MSVFFFFSLIPVVSEALGSSKDHWKMHACLSKNKAKGKAFNLEKVDQNIQQLAQEQTFLIVDGKQPAHQSTEHEEACDAVQFPGGARRASDQQVGYGICQMVSIFTSAQPTSRIWYP